MDPYQTALELLSYRWRSERELRDRLASRSVPRQEIDAAIERLTNEGWIDDERFAKEYVRSRSRRHGRRRIGDDLRRLGVEDHEISSALDEELDHEDEDRRLRELTRKKIESLSNRYGNAYPASEVGRRKLARFLLQKGYPDPAVRKVVFELTSPSSGEADDEERGE